MAITGQKFIPGLLDEYLGRTGYDSQQHDGAEDPNRPNNLWEPVDATRDHGAHGSFDKRAKGHSRELFASEHFGLISGLATALGIGVAALLRARSKQQRDEEPEWRAAA